MASAGFSYLCTAPAGSNVACSAVFPAGATVAFYEQCQLGSCASGGIFVPADTPYCYGEYWDPNVGGMMPAEAICNVQYAGPIPDAMTIPDALEVSWAIVLAWAVTWGVRRLIGYAADHAVS